MGLGVRIELVGLLVLLSVVGLAAVLRPSALPGGGAHVDGPLLVSESPGLLRSGSDALIEGAITYDSGCLRVGDHVAVWPHGTSWDAEDVVVVLRSGDRVGEGDVVSGSGGFAARDAFDAEAYDDEGERLVADCVGDGDGVAVYNLGAEVTLVGRVP